jgi:hypothetical protein
MSESASAPTVLIVGGLFAACELARHVTIVDGSAEGFDAAAAGAPGGGAVLVRPDGFIGFRAAPADATTMAALDAHLASYLIPAGGA